VLRPYTLKKKCGGQVKTFFDAWLLEAPAGLSQELSGTVRLLPGEPLSDANASICCQVELQGGMKGSFWIMVDSSALAKIFVSARVTADEADPERDAQLWQGIIRQVAARAAKSAGKEAGAPVSVADINLAAQPAGPVPVPYQLRFGDLTSPIAFIDQTQIVSKVKETIAATDAAPVRGVELLLDVELDASLRFGSKEMPLSDVLDLGPGDVVQLERHVSDPVDLIVGDKIVARGEVVLVNGNFGLRVTEVAEPRKSLESIRCLF
jgi:flagellar motor switch protein FliN